MGDVIQFRPREPAPVEKIDDEEFDEEWWVNDFHDEQALPLQVYINDLLDTRSKDEVIGMCREIKAAVARWPG